MTQGSERSEPADCLLQHADFVTRLSRALLRDEQLAADAAQETMLAAVANPPRHDGNLRGWLGQVLRRVASRMLRGGRRQQRAAQQAPEPTGEAGPMQVAASLEQHRDLTQAVMGLPEAYRDAVSLRYLEGLSVDEVAARTGVPRNTARSRLTRGLGLLRERLDARHGSRSAWVALLAPIAARPLSELAAGAGAAGAAAAAPAAATTAVLLMKKISVVAVVAAVLVSGWFLLGDDAPAALPAAPGQQPVAASAAAAERIERRAAELRAQQEVPIVREIAQVAAAATPAAAPVDRLVDVFLRPLAGLRVRREEASAVRWQGGDFGWIAGPKESLKLSIDELERLRTDEAAAETFFAARAFPQQWRAAILGAPLPEQEVRTDADGVFSFGGEKAELDDIALVENGWTLLARPKERGGVFVGAPAVQLRGRIVDEAGEPVRGAKLRVDVSRSLPAGAGSLLPAAVPEMRATADGSFVLWRVPVAAGVLLRVFADGYAPAVLSVPRQDRRDLDVTLWRLEEGAVPVVDGVVVDDAQQPVVGANVLADRVQARTDEAGRFRLEVPTSDPLASLTVLAEGRAAWHRRGFGRRLLDDPNSGRGLRIVLGAPSRTLRLAVLEPDGAPAAGYGVNLVDPALLGFSFTSVEARCGGRERSVRTDGQGRVALTGLGDRSYFVRIWNQRTGFQHIHGPVRAGEVEEVLRLPAAAASRRVRGRCVGADGEPVAGAAIAIAFCTYVTRGGGTMWEDTGALGRSGADGTFEVDVPAGGAGVLMALDGDGRRAVLPIEAMAAGDVELTFAPKRRWLRLLPTAAGPLLPVVAVDAGGARRAFRVIGADGDPVEHVTPMRPTLIAVDGDVVALRIAPSTSSERTVLLDESTTHVHVRGGF